MPNDIKGMFSTGKKNDIEQAKESGIINENDFVVTNDTHELAFIDKDKKTNFIKSRTQREHVLKGTSLGALNPGDKLPTNIDIDDLIDMIGQKRIKAEYQKPSVSLSNNGGQAAGAVEAGTSVTPKLRATFNKNDAGNLTKIEVLKGGVSISDGTTTPHDYAGEAFVVGDETVTFSAKATYEEGAIKNDNLGQPSPEDHIEAGYVTSGNYSITGQRNTFWGSGVGLMESPTSDVIRKLANKKLNVTAGAKISMKVATGQQYIMFVLPEPRTLTQVIYDDLGDKGMLSSFTKTTVQVADARGGENGLKNYNCYVYNLATPCAAAMNFTFVIG